MKDWRGRPLSVSLKNQNAGEKNIKNGLKSLNTNGSLALSGGGVAAD